MTRLVKKMTERLLAISDIHGKKDTFIELLNNIGYDSAQDQLILLGDYVDRGPNSRAVLNQVIRLQEEGAIVLRGNHDDMLVAAYRGEPGALERWERNGAIHTLQNYDSTIETMTIPQTDEFRQHVEFIESLAYYHETPDYIFVHAGINPARPLEDTDPFDFVWIRDAFFKEYSGDKTVIFGHTPTSLLHDDQHDHSIYFGTNNIIGIDGAAVYGGNLNCLELPSKRVFSVKG